MCLCKIYNVNLKYNSDNSQLLSIVSLWGISRWACHLANGKPDDEAQNDDQSHAEADDNIDLFLRACVRQSHNNAGKITGKKKKKT